VGVELAAAGAPKEIQAAWQAKLEAQAPSECEVLPECWDAVLLFARCATQWRTAGMSGIRTGLDYPAVRLVARAMGVAWSEALLADVQVMEFEALAVWSEESRRDA
jgi:hypothetical protein